MFFCLVEFGPRTGLNLRGLYLHTQKAPYFSTYYSLLVDLLLGSENEACLDLIPATEISWRLLGSCPSLRLVLECLLEPWLLNGLSNISVNVFSLRHKFSVNSPLQRSTDSLHNIPAVTFHHSSLQFPVCLLSQSLKHNNKHRRTRSLFACCVVMVVVLLCCVPGRIIPTGSRGQGKGGSDEK